MQLNEAAQKAGMQSRRTMLDEGFIGALTNKWAGLLEGVPNRTAADNHMRGWMSMLFENQMDALQRWNLNEDTRSINTGPFTKFIFPVLRNVFPNLISPEISSVQPMTGPVGAVFYLDYIYSSTKAPTTAGQVYPLDFNADYTSERINGEALATGDGVNYGGAGNPLNVTLAWTPVRPFDATLGYKVEITETVPATGAVVQTAVDDGTGNFTFTPAGGSTNGDINYSNGSISAFKFQNAPANGNDIKAVYQYNGELNTKIPTASLDVKKKLIEAKARRLKSIWSAEAAEDLKALHGVNAETELVMSMANEMALEIDRENIDNMFKVSGGTTSTFDRVPPAGIPELDHLRSMLTNISTVSNLIHKKTLRAPANWLVTSPEISALISQLTTHADFRPAFVSGMESPFGPMDPPKPLTRQGQFGIYKVGTVMNKWVLYEDPFFPRDFMLIGLKGATYLDSGYAWAPYIPLEMTETFLDPNDLSLRKAMRTRYATAVLRPDFYGQMRVLNL